MLNCDIIQKVISIFENKKNYSSQIMSTEYSSILRKGILYHYQNITLFYLQIRGPNRLFRLKTVT